ncbi:predicted protein [Botrytis cinerea T4]|uniref:Uncharacterized protein n=1 Tax=Botryotinia fuckeliana (strain T4) TaxID=999810 RepID=G2YX28_BOTF4|nr:predicted protein [Botrytis cinerea T4]
MFIVIHFVRNSFQEKVPVPSDSFPTLYEPGQYSGQKRGSHNHANLPSNIPTCHGYLEKSVQIDLNNQTALKLWLEKLCCV